MNSIYRDSIQNDLDKLENVLYELISQAYTSSENGVASEIGEVELSRRKGYAIERIKDLCPCLRHKLELLNYKLQTINTFNWDNKIEFQNLNKGKGVAQNLHNGNLEMLFKNQETMDNFIYSEISGFVSIICGIIDLLAEILFYTFNVEIKGSRLKTIIGVAENIKNQTISGFLKQNFCDNYKFFGVRDLRTQCEHRDHFGIVQIQKIKTVGFPGGMVKEVTDVRINFKLFENGLPEELIRIPDGDSVGNYSQFVYRKLTGAVQEMVVKLRSI